MKRPVIGVIGNSRQVENRFPAQFVGEKNLRAVADVACALPMMFAGTPDQVYDQVVDFYQAVGGFGHFLMMSQAGQMGHEDTVESMTLFAREVMPRLQDFHAAAQLAA